MKLLEVIWRGLRNEREKIVFLEGFWEGVNATEAIQKQVRGLGEEVEHGYNGYKASVQQNSRTL